LLDNSAAKVDQLGSGHREERSTCSKRTTKRDIIKIGTINVVIQGNNEGPMIFGKSPEEEDT
jgi:VCBS repeat-containing protein